MGKYRLSPLKLLTIRQLELSAAVVADRLDKVIRTETDIDVDDSVFWTDSTCFLGYLAGIMGSLRRGSVKEQLVVPGPDFLWRPQSSWPIASSPVLEVTPADPEVKSTARYTPNSKKSERKQ